MRKQTKKIKELKAEYEALKTELFGNDSFVEPLEEDKPKWKRYEDLRGYFYPNFRTKNWSNPLVVSE